MPTLNDKVIAYLTINSITYTVGQYLTGIPEDSDVDQIIYWDIGALGPEPTQAQLDEAYPIWEGQQIAAQNKVTATQLLQETDWTAPTSIADPVESQPYLANRAAFLNYRSQVRQIAVNPPTTPAVFPTMPDEQWATS